MEYMIPNCTQRTELEFNKSRFISTAGFAPTVDEAKSFIGNIREELPSASHHVFAYRVGFGNSVIEGMSDDGEPTGTSGPPILSVIRGTTIGDIVIVVTRFYGGRKLGKGGLVRAYTQSAQEILKQLPLKQKVQMVAVTIVSPYHFYDQVKRHIESSDGHIESENFRENVTILLKIKREYFERFSTTIIDTTAGNVIPILEHSI